VAARDRGRCAFVARSGRLCGSRDFVEFHHKEPWARSRRHPVEGIELRCRAHNHYAAVQDYGAAHMDRCRGSGRKNTQPRTRAGASSRGASRDALRPDPTARPTRAARGTARAALRRRAASSREDPAGGKPPTEAQLNGGLISDRF
jgi:hypothetical protein